MDNRTKCVMLIILGLMVVLVYFEIYGSVRLKQSDNLLNLRNLPNDSNASIWIKKYVSSHSNSDIRSRWIATVTSNTSSYNTHSRTNSELVHNHFSESLVVNIRNRQMNGSGVSSKEMENNYSAVCHKVFDMKAISVPDTLDEFKVDTLHRSTPYSAYWVDVDAPLLYRIKIYNQAITFLRNEIKKARGYSTWADPGMSPVVLWGSRDDYLEQLSNFTNVRTVILSWIKSQCNGRNLLIWSYPEWTASEPLCTWLKTPGKTKARWDAVYNRTCSTDLSDTLLEGSLRPVYLHGKPINPDHYWPNKGNFYPSHFYTDPPPYVLYLHIIEDAIVTSVGDIFTKSLKIVPYSCSHDLSPVKPEGYNQLTIYSEVFCMSGNWGTSHFHRSVELIPRVAPYLDFLLKNPEIVIQVSEVNGRTADILAVFGIAKERLLSGTLRAKIVYLPQATPCGFGQVQELQLLSKQYRDHIYTLKKVPSKVPNLVMVHRSGLRRLTDVLHIEMLVQKLAAHHGLNFKLYHDQQLPSFQETMIMFNEAAMVVAPHGAGLSNIMFCEPGTFLIEFLCNPPHVNMCYQRVAHVLGMRYHGIPSEEGCEDHIKVNPKLVEFVVRVKLEQWKFLHNIH